MGMGATSTSSNTDQGWMSEMVERMEENEAQTKDMKKLLKSVMLEIVSLKTRVDELEKEQERNYKVFSVIF